MIAVVIPTYKPTNILYHLIKSLEIQTQKPNQIILMNTEKKSFGENLTKQELQEIVENEIVEIHHIEKRAFNHGKTRNDGFSFAKEEIVVSMTQDVTIIDANMLEHLMKPFCDKNVVVSFARQLPYETCKIEEKWIRNYNYPEQSRITSQKDVNRLGIKTYFSSNVCAAYVKEKFDELGGFEPKVIFNEDMLFAAKAMKAGYAVSYTAEAKVMHSHNYSNKEQFQRNFDLAVSQANHPEVFAKLHSESTGKKMVAEIAKKLMQKGKWYLLPRLFFTSFWKYAGYFLGKRYRRLSKRFVLKCSMNKNYWLA